jgi:hypothetical protein
LGKKFLAKIIHRTKNFSNLRDRNHGRM